MPNFCDATVLQDDLGFDSTIEEIILKARHDQCLDGHETTLLLKYFADHLYALQANFDALEKRVVALETERHLPSPHQLELAFSHLPRRNDHGLHY